MAKPYEVLRFEGDFHMFRINEDESLTAILDRPIEASGVVTQFEEGETRNVISKGRDRYNTPIYSEQDPGVPSLQMTLLEFPDDIKALLFAGSLTVTEEAGAAVTNEVVIAPGAGNIVKLAHGMIAASGIAVTNTAGSTTYDVTDDYTIDRTFGVLRISEGSAITEGQTIHVDYTYTAVKVTKIAGGVKPQQRFKVIGYLKNRPTGRDAFLEVFDVKLGRSGDTDVLGDEPLTIELTGVMTTPPGKTSPFEYTERVDNA